MRKASAGDWGGVEPQSGTPAPDAPGHRSVQLCVLAALNQFGPEEYADVALPIEERDLLFDAFSSV